VIDVYIPAAMNIDALHSPGWSWFRILVRPRPGFSPEQVRQPIEAWFANDHQERLKEFHSDTPKQAIDTFLRERILLFPAASGASDVQTNYRRPLWILGLLVGLVLLVACVNVGNLLTAQAAARSREMALRVSIGAGQWRLIQLVLVESALIAGAASALGLVFAAWSAPLVVSMLRVPEDPVRLVLVTGWRELAWSAALALAVTLLFGLAPALRASGVKPAAALRGEEHPHRHRRMMNVMLAAQMAFCVTVQFVAALFVATFERLASRPLGFSYERVLVVDMASPAKQPVETWMQTADRLRQVTGVESASVACWNLLSGNGWRMSVRGPGNRVMPRSPAFLEISPGFFETMQIAWLDGRDFRSGDGQPRVVAGRPAPGVGIVNQEFARVYFDGQNPVGRFVEVRPAKDVAVQMEIVGYVRDAVYANVRETIHPTVYVPQVARNRNMILVRTTGNPLALAPALRGEIMLARPDFRVLTIQPESNFIRWQLLRERLMAVLSLFFAVVALVLAAIGLYGVLNYSVTRQRREIGIRMALGARSGHVVRRVTIPMAAMVCAGSAIGLSAGVAGGRYLESLLFEVRPTDLGMMALPLALLCAAALLSGLPAAIRAVRIDPAQTLRGD
jgi:predicted permease